MRSRATIHRMLGLLILICLLHPPVDAFARPDGTPPRSATIEITELRPNKSRENRLSMDIHLRVQAQGYRGETLRVGAFFYWDDDTMVVVSEAVSSSFRTPEGQLTVQRDLTPSYDNSLWEDLVLSVPYGHIPPQRRRAGYVSAGVFLDGVKVAGADENRRFSMFSYDTELPTGDDQTNQDEGSSSGPFTNPSGNISDGSSINPGGGSFSGLYTSPGETTSSTPSSNQGGGASGSTTGATVDCEAVYDGLFSQLTSNQYAVGGYLDSDLNYHDPVISDAGCAILLDRLEAIDAMGCNLALVTSSYQQQADTSDTLYDSCKRRHPDDWDRTCRTQYYNHQIVTTQLVEFQELGIWNTECHRRN